jgi:hypothetical protein
VLSNENPIGSYNAKFRLNNKAKGMSTYSNENRIPYGYQELSLFVFHESTEYENITDYHNRGSSFRFYIKIKSSAIIPNNPDNIIRYYHRSDFRREKRKQEKIKKREERKEKNMPKLVSTPCLNLLIQTAGLFVLGVIVPIPPHTQNFIGKKIGGKNEDKISIAICNVCIFFKINLGN